MLDGALRFLILAQNRWLRKSRFVTWVLFGVKILPAERIHWDFTTLVLKKALIKYTRPGQEVFEIGTGPYALLSTFLIKRTPCRIMASDINGDYVKRGIENARHNRADISIIQSDLLQRASGRFDIIFWNSVYIPREAGIKYGVSSLYLSETDWCGGDSGYEAIAKFLAEAGSHLSESGRILLGYNEFYLKRKAVEELCRANGFVIGEFVSSKFNPGVVAVMARVTG